MQNKQNYIDGFVLPIPKDHITLYREVAEKVAEIWKEHGALSYNEYLGDDLTMQGIKTFPDAINASNDEVIVFGWVAFKNRETRDYANKMVAADPRMNEIIAPLTQSTGIIFDAKRMVFGGFKPLF